MSDVAHDHPEWMAHHFHTAQQQQDSAKLGMWAFLVQGILFFGGLFMAYIAFRYLYPETYLHAHHQLDWRMGSVNTIVLLFSSVTMALAVRACQVDNKKQQVMYMGITLVCATIFMVVKYFEYTAKIGHGFLPGENYTGHGVEGMPHIFFTIYFIMTGTHGLHVLIGMGILVWLMWRASKGHFTSKYYATVENFGLYWHLVDLIWIFLFPLLYLVR